jgi:ABC-type transporter Mla subunit MlaD
MVGAAAVALTVIFLVPVLLKVRKTIGEVGGMVSDARPQTVTLLKRAQNALDDVNRELTAIEEITDETQELVRKLGEASTVVEGVVKSPMTKVGLITAGAAASGYVVRKRLGKRVQKG